MIAKAKDIMTTRFHRLKPDMSLTDAIRLFHVADQEEGNKVFGMVVVNDQDELVGMLSMYDILLFIRPSKSRNWEDMDDLEINHLLNLTCQRMQTTLVGDIMTTDVITVTPETHVVKILDTMIRRLIRRLPVLDEKRMVGMVYISHIFEYFGSKVVCRP